MNKNYLEILSKFHPGVSANCNGDPSIYSNIEWIDTPIQQTTLDSEYLSLLKLKRNEQIDTKTTEIIDQGFTYDSCQFSLSPKAQINWLGLKALETLITFPLDLTTVNDGSYSLTSDNVDAFVGTAVSIVQTTLTAGRLLKLQVNSANTEAELDAIVDNR